MLVNPDVTCAIPGAKNVAQITANAAAADGALSEADLSHLAEITGSW